MVSMLEGGYKVGTQHLTQGPDLENIVSVTLIFPQTWMIKKSQDNTAGDPEQKHFSKNAVWMNKRLHFWSL